MVAVRPMYRAKQFFRAFRRRDPGAFVAVAQAYLSPSQLALFKQMSPYDQEHAVEVLSRLRRQGWRDAELMQAALLHDVGKAFVRSSLWRRVAHVLLWAAETDDRPRGGYARHAELGAEAAERVGSPPEVVALIRRHHAPLPLPPRDRLDDWLIALHVVDEMA
ncbi:MAG: HD domain-containing protein [Anaerolineae bacterium]|nr:HD domain-containing protein [Anaerolineae bacterium]